MTNNSLVDFMDASDAVNNSKHTLEDGTYWNWSNGVEIATTRAVAQFVAFTSVIIIHFVITFVNYKHRISESLILRFSLLFIDLFASLEAIKVLQQSQICFLFQATRILLEWAYAKLIAKTSLDKKEISITEILRRPLSVIAIIGVTSIIRSTSKTFLIFLKATWHLCLLYVFLKLWLVEKGWFHTFLASAQLLRLASFIGEHNVLKAPGPIKCELSLIGEASSAIIHNLYLTWSLWSDGTETIRRSQMSSSYRNPNILESKNFTFFVFIGLCTLPFVSESILYPPRVSEDCAKFQHILNSQTIEIIWLLLLTFKTSVGLVDGESSGPLVDFVKFVVHLTYKVKLSKEEYQKSSGKLHTIMVNRPAAQLLGYRITALADTTRSRQNPRFTLEVQFRWNNPSLSLDEAQKTFEKWIKDFNLLRRTEASSLEIKQLLYT